MAENIIKDVKLKIGTETQFQSKLKELPLNTLVGTTDPIQEGELDTSIITKLNKADNALPKPTNDTTGSAGQVLKKTANGSEWGDAPSGGGKLYRHKINLIKDDMMTAIIINVYRLTPDHIPLNSLSTYCNGMHAFYSDEITQRYIGQVYFNDSEHISFDGTIINPISEPHSWKTVNLNNVALSVYGATYEQYYSVIEM